MSADAIASVYTMMLNDDEFRELVAETPALLDKYPDLTGQEKELLVSVASAEVEGFSFGQNAVVGYIGANLPLTPTVGSAFGVAMARQAGLPTSSLFPSGGADCDCCKWKGGFQAGAWVVNPAP